MTRDEIVRQLEAVLDQIEEQEKPWVELMQRICQEATPKTHVLYLPRRWALENVARPTWVHVSSAITSPVVALRMTLASEPWFGWDFGNELRGTDVPSRQWTGLAK